MNPTIKQMFNSVCVWIDSTAMSQMIQNTPWIVPAVQTVHILAIAALMASMLMINLRVVGMVGRDQPLARVSARYTPVIWWALPVLLISGAIYVEGGKPGEQPATWVLEMTSPGNLMRAGVWKRTSFKPDDKVDVDMAPLRDGKRGGALKKITNTESGLSLNANLREQEGLVEK